MRKILGIISAIIFVIVFLGALLYAIMSKGFELHEAIKILGFVLGLTAILVTWIIVTVNLLMD